MSPGSAFNFAGDGKENRCTAPGDDSNRARSNVPSILKANWMAPDFGYGLERSGRVIDSVYGVCGHSSIMQIKTSGKKFV